MIFFYAATLVICIGFAVEQACFFLFATYPYRYGLSINAFSVILRGYDQHDASQLGCIYNALTHHHQYATTINYSSHEIYVIKKYSFFMSMAVQLMGARLLFSNKWTIQIKIGLFTLLFFIYIFVIAIALHISAFDIGFILLIILLYIFTFVSEFLKMKKVLSIIEDC